MAILRGSVEADVPIQFADSEWSEFVFRYLYGNYARGFSEVASTVDLDADNGTVKLETKDDRLVRVTVELEYTPRSESDSAAEIARAQAGLDRDLERYRTFLVQRCEQESCRPS